MIRILRLSVLLLALVAVSSCTKTKYCQCSAFIDNVDVPLGEDYYIIEHGTCNDKAKEIVGWGSVTCVEVELEDEEHWWDFIFPNHNNNNNNNNNNNKP
ncbi:MAG: hypothetical protein K6A28_01505 [Bacteroidales bacterium]|nr:hypothetical protein [Bacteroidales bacterium]